MTIDAVRRKSTRASRRPPQEELLPIGETDANIFNCPACARPLGVGTTRCPGCSTRLISGIRATRAAGFMAIGLMVGLVVGGGAVGLVAYLTAPAAVAAVGTDSIVTPTSAPLASAPAPGPRRGSGRSGIGAVRPAPVHARESAPRRRCRPAGSRHGNGLDRVGRHRPDPAQPRRDRGVRRPDRARRGRLDRRCPGVGSVSPPSTQPSGPRRARVWRRRSRTRPPTGEPGRRCSRSWPTCLHSTATLERWPRPRTWTCPISSRPPPPEVRAHPTVRSSGAGHEGRRVAGQLHVRLAAERDAIARRASPLRALPVDDAGRRPRVELLVGDRRRERRSTGPRPGCRSSSRPGSRRRSSGSSSGR